MSPFEHGEVFVLDDGGEVILPDIFYMPCTHFFEPLAIIMRICNLVVEFSYSKRIPFHSCLICNLVKG